MKENVGMVDRIIRLIIGLAILSWGIKYSNWWGLIGLVPLFTGLAGYCALYSLFGISTKK